MGFDGSLIEQYDCLTQPENPATRLPVVAHGAPLIDQPFSLGVLWPGGLAQHAIQSIQQAPAKLPRVGRHHGGRHFSLPGEDHGDQREAADGKRRYTSITHHQKSYGDPGPLSSNQGMTNG